MRHYPALDLSWPSRPSDDHLEVLLAAIDDERPTAVEERAQGICVFFASAESRDHARTLIGAVDASVDCEPVDVPDESWAERSQAALTPVRAGSLTIAPPWSAQDGDIVIQPSMGFGTGHHASTRLCLRLLQTIDVRDRRVIDVGTGSGVLALAACRLGAARVVGIDFDPDAVTSAQENLALNRTDDRVTVAVGDLDDETGAASGRFDVVLANLTGALLERQADRLCRLVSPHGHAILSGIQSTEAGAVVAAFQAAGARPIDRLDEDEWVGLIFTTPTPSTGR